MSSAQSATDSVVFDQPENPSSSLCSGDVGQLMTFPTQTLVQTAATTTTITSSLVMMDTSDGLSDSDASMHSDCYSGSQISDSDYIDEDEYGSDMDDDGIDVDRSESHHRHHHCHHQGVGRAPGRGHSHGQHLSLGHAHNHNANLGSAVRTNGSSSSIAASLTAASSTASDANSSAEGQAALRKRILMIQQDATLSSTDKASKIQDLMSSGWTNRQKLHAGRTSTAPNKLENKLEDFNSIEDADRIPTWHNREANILGCKHYQRAAKLQAHCCGRWFSCRFCHDEVSDHNIVRLMGRHKCIERNLESDCPICGEYMFTSTTTVIFMSPLSAGDLSGASYSNDVVFSGSYASGVPVSRSVRARTQSISAQSLDPHMRRTSASGPSSSSNASGCN
ncbi:hypothetical protein BSLG_003257 [Batrachochytrium salamandrivorans]|nr:hypothetical protein BSLG_003257 [Batrachochytrium salamandrivorans]